jgi:uncharacterized membrane protein
MKTKRNKKLGSHLSISMILVGLLFLLFKIHPLAIGLILGGVVLFISSLYYAKKPETEVIVDERIRKINDRAGHYAFWITLFLLSAIFWMSFFKPFRVSLREAYEIVLLGGLYSWIFLRFYFSKKGLE